MQLAVFTVPGRLVTSLVLFGCIQPATQIAGAAIGYHHTGKRDMAAIATASEYADAVVLRDQLATMKRPSSPPMEHSSYRGYPRKTTLLH